jgi:hypothetical protein
VASRQARGPSVGEAWQRVRNRRCAAFPAASPVGAHPYRELRFSRARSGHWRGRRAREWQTRMR